MKNFASSNEAKNRKKVKIISWRKKNTLAHHQQCVIQMFKIKFSISISILNWLQPQHITQTYGWKWHLFWTLLFFTFSLVSCSLALFLSSTAPQQQQFNFSFQYCLHYYCSLCSNFNITNYPHCTVLASKLTMKNQLVSRMHTTQVKPRKINNIWNKHSARK